MRAHDEDVLDRELDRLVEQLPAQLRADWVVIPRRIPMQVFLVGLLFGAGAALTVVGYRLDIEPLQWVWPAVVIALLLTAKLVPWWRGDRLEEQLRAQRRGGQPPQPPRS